MIYKTLALSAAIAVTLSSPAFAQDKVKTVPSDTETAVPVMAEKIQPIVGESQDKMMSSGGEDRLTENVSLAAPGGGSGKANFQDLSLAKEMVDPKIGPIKGESQDKAAIAPTKLQVEGAKEKASAGQQGLGAIIAIGAVNEDGSGLDAGDVQAKASEDRYLKIGDIKGESQDKAVTEEFAPVAGAALGVASLPSEPCVTVDGDADADCNGVADPATKTDYERKRPEPRQQRR